MQAKTTNVSWDTYAQTYDMLLDYNPFYQALHQEVMDHLREWNIPEGAVLADLGAGTGNYSLEMARQFPQATILHFDSDHGMNAQTAAKRPVSLTNHHIYCKSIDEIELAEESLDGLISIHALYTFPDPFAALQDMYRWLTPGASAVLVNCGRVLDIFSWQVAIGGHLLLRHGLKKMLQIMREGKEVSRQNAYIRRMQQEGIYWTHTHEQFCDAIRAAGFVIGTAGKTFRGYSDLAVVRKSI